MNNENYDIVIIGAGLSGVGAAVHLAKAFPKKTVRIYESRDDLGGTWDLFRYPGIRSDSDMFTLGYSFKPWLHDQSIADGGLIRDYIREAAHENNIFDRIQFGHRIVSMDWSSKTQNWNLRVSEKGGADKEVAAGFVMSCTGYYDYKSGYDPEFVGRDEFRGDIVHPQHWPENFDYKNKRVVIIGSGATAVTLAPEMAPDAAQVTVLQRSPSYVMNRPKMDPKLKSWRKRFPEKLYYRLARGRNIVMQYLTYKYCRVFPDKAREMIRSHIAEAVGPNVDMKHFSPDYNPWDERLCAVTENDLFKSLKNEEVLMVTDHIERFTESGILLKSGQELKADVIITATGLNLQMFGGIDLSVDNKKYDPAQKMCYRDLMLEDLPNLAFIFGYTSASWTLKADIVMKYICRVLRYMDKKSNNVVIPTNTGNDPGGIPFSDMQSGYMARARSRMPLRGHRAPWTLQQNYFLDSVTLKYSRINDGKLLFS